MSVLEYCRFWSIVGFGAVTRSEMRNVFRSTISYDNPLGFYILNKDICIQNRDIFNLRRHICILIRDICISVNL